MKLTSYTIIILRDRQGKKNKALSYLDKKGKKIRKRVDDFI